LACQKLARPQIFIKVAPATPDYNHISEECGKAFGRPGPIKATQQAKLVLLLENRDRRHKSVRHQRPRARARARTHARGRPAGRPLRLRKLRTRQHRPRDPTTRSLCRVMRASQKTNFARKRSAEARLLLDDAKE